MLHLWKSIPPLVNKIIEIFIYKSLSKTIIWWGGLEIIMYIFFTSYCTKCNVRIMENIKKNKVSVN